MIPIDAAFDTVASFANLRAAARHAARGKRATASVARFLFGLERELLALQRELQAGTWRPGVPFLFEILDPKPRTISAAPFRDRVVHHALIDPIEQRLDGWLCAETFACRRGKGQHRALGHAQRLLRRHGWFLKLDVKSFFPSLRHDVVMATLAEVVADARTLRLCEAIVRQPAGASCGLPIGNLTSQWFANLVLGRLDRHVLFALRPAGYARYMDDFVLFAGDQQTLRAMHGEVATFLADQLQLALKPSATILAPATQGLPFLGWRIYRGLRRLRPENLRRTRARLRQRRRQLANGAIDERRYADSVRAVTEHLRQGNALRLRRALFAGADENTAADHFLRQPQQPRWQLQQRPGERAVRQPQPQRTVDPQRQPGSASRQDVPSPDPDGRAAPAAHRLAAHS